MATNIIYKGELNGTQVDFQTGSLTDISTFDTDVRSSAIQNSITDGVTDRGASQDALIAMSGYLAANAHPDVTEAADFDINNAGGNVLQSVEFVFDDLGHATTADFSSVNLDDRYYTETEVGSISGALNSKISSNDSELTTLRTATGTLSTATGTLSTATGNLDGRINSNDGELTVLRAATGVLRANVDSNDTELGVLRAATGVLNTNITGNDAELVTLRTATGYLENEIDDLQAVSGSFLSLNLDDVTDVNAVTTNDITVGDIRVGGGTITGPTTITIDPDSSGPAGTVIIQGDLQVEGTTTSISSTDDQIGDINLILGTGAANDAAANGGGLIISGTAASTIAEFTYDSTNNRWNTNSIDIAADIVGDLAGNASTASKWSAETTITLGGDLGGSVAFDGSDTSESLVATIANDAVQAVHLNDDIEGDNVTVTNGVISVADTDIRAAIIGGASSIAGTDLGASKALISNASGKVAVSTVTSTELSKLAGIGSSTVAAQLALKADDSTTMSASDGLTGGGTLAADRSFSTTADQGHLDEIGLGSDNTSISNVATKGGILILRGTDNNGITTSGSDGNAVALNSKTTVAFEGVVQSADIAQDADNGSYVAMWKIQGVIRRDSDSTDMLSSFVTKTFAGSNASAYGLSVSVNGNGLKIASDQATATLITSATINYNWIEDTSA